jgi:heme exporter protein A
MRAFAMDSEMCVSALGEGPSAAVTLRDLGKRYGRRWIFSGLSGGVQHGATLAVAGPNGSGKSTLIKLIATLLQPDAGALEICVGGRTLDGFDRRRAIGWVSPEAGLYMALTGAEHVRLFAALYGVRLTDEGIRAALERVGLSPRSKGAVGTYSSGMRQRLRYACAMLHEPPILLLDEPFMALDEDGVRMVSELVERQRLRGVAIVAGNSAAEISLGDRVVDLRDFGPKGRAAA